VGAVELVELVEFVEVLEVAAACTVRRSYFACSMWVYYSMTSK
jgi:hypothetical protein